MEILAVIPARVGSKGIPRKNIAPIAGHPLIAWTILEAQKSKSLSRIVVSTDSEEIAAVARRYQAEVPFLRPADLAQDETPGIAPALHALHWMEEKEGCRPNYVMYLQPTSPLRTAQDIEGAIDLLQKKRAEAVISVTEADQHPFWMKTISPEGKLEDFQKADRAFDCRQELPLVYTLNGAIYLTRREVLLEKRSFYSEATYAYVMPRERSIDIDTAWDLRLAGMILQERGHHASP